MIGIVVYAVGKWGADGSVGQSRNCRAKRAVRYSRKGHGHGRV
jgi:hypothetical protein